MSENINPLQKHFRRPAIYFKLPSQGQFWPEGSLELTVTGDLAVLPMTTMDEITIRTPDALLNGQGVVDLIKSCVPSIKDPWGMPSVDVDATLIAIRIASYSNMMEIESNCPHCDEKNSYLVDLNNILANIRSPDYTQTLKYDNLVFAFKPQKYFEMNKANLVRFEEQKIINLVRDDTISDEEKTQYFAEQVKRLVDISNSAYVACTSSVTTEEGIVVRDELFINEFYKNCARSTSNAVKGKLEEFAEAAKIKPIDVKCNECQKDFKVNVSFDYSHFFA